MRFERFQLYIKRATNKEEEERLPCGVSSFEELNLRVRFGLVPFNSSNYNELSLKEHISSLNYKGSVRDALSALVYGIECTRPYVLELKV